MPVLLCFLAFPALAGQEYSSNYGPVIVPTGRENGWATQPGPLWVVVTGELEVHHEPSAGSPVVARFKRGSILEVELGRGGSDEVSLNAKDEDGHYWMPVRLYDGKPYEAYVRANSDFIVPTQP